MLSQYIEGKCSRNLIDNQKIALFQKHLNLKDIFIPR